MDQVVFGDPRVSAAVWRKLREEDESGCWVYLGKFTPSGWPVHNHRAVWRLLYERLVGPVPPTVSMLCEVDPKLCSNPYHRLSPYGQRITPHVCPVCQKLHAPDLTES
jgi:hypothetical protein